MENEASQFRDKPTDIERTIPAVSTWPSDRLRRYRYTDLDGERPVLTPLDYARNDPFPLPMPIDREGYATEENSDRYWSSGLADWLNVEDALKRYAAASDCLHILDFGCASGRFLRHALLQSKSATNVWGCDLAPANVQWITRHLPKEINSCVNSNKPILPFDENQFDAITAFSVFTHIDQQEAEWLNELKRIVRPGGILYITIHNDASWRMIKNRDATIKQFEHQNTFEDNLHVTNEMLSQPIPQERIVFRKDHEPVYNCNVWHSDEYIHREWSKHFEIIQIADNAHANFQSPVILRNGQ